jgi:hypothetical protein
MSAIAPSDRSSRLALIRGFNNTADARVVRWGNREGYAFRATHGSAEGVARAGFVVVHLGADRFVAIVRS